MRTFLLISNAVIALISLACFIYSFAGRQQINDAAREFVLTKTHKHAVGAADLISGIIDLPLVKLHARKAHRKAVEDELADFRAEPDAYLRRLTAETAIPKSDGSPDENKAAGMIHGWKEGIRRFYQRTLDNLIGDLRIFLGSNFAAAGLALGFALAGRKREDADGVLILYSLLLLIAVGYSAGLYFHHLSFFRILFSMHMGWMYPVFMGLAFFGLWMRQRREAKEQAEAAGRGAASSGL